MNDNKIFALNQELKRIIDRIDSTKNHKPRLEGFLKEQNFEDCAEYMKKFKVPTCGYFLELIKRNQDYSWNFS